MISRRTDIRQSQNSCSSQTVSTQRYKPSIRYPKTIRGDRLYFIWRKRFEYC